MGQPIAVGTKAPDFTLQDQDQNDVTLSSFQGKKNVVLAFYPLDFSPVCSKEHACFRDDLKGFEGHNAQVLGVSVDSAWAHKAFARHLGVSYPLLADFHPRGQVAAKFGLYPGRQGHHAARYRGHRQAGSRPLRPRERDTRAARQQTDRTKPSNSWVHNHFERPELGETSGIADARFFPGKSFARAKELRGVDEALKR